VAIGQQAKTARAWAAEIVSAWIEGRPTAPLVAQIPEHLQPLSSALARSTCEAIKAHARAPLPEYGKNLQRFAALVERYKALRQK